MKLIGTDPDAEVEALDLLPGISNYFIGSDASRWRTNIPNFARVRYRNVYPGIDLDFYGEQGRLEYDFVVAAGADPQAIRFAFEGVRQMRLDSRGDLLLSTARGAIILHKPLVWQEIGPQRQEVAGRFVLGDGKEVRFEVEGYDRSEPLVIDPVLSYSTYLGGGNSDGVAAVAVDSSGNAYVTGHTFPGNFPVTPGVFQPALASPPGISSDVFAAKINATGTALIYSTYAGNAYVSGDTFSADFFTTPGALQTVFGGTTDGFVAKLNASGSGVVYSTYLGGSGSDAARLAVDSSGSAYVTGTTSSVNFHTTAGAFQTSAGIGFVTKLNAAGSGLLYPLS